MINEPMTKEPLNQISEKLFFIKDEYDLIKINPQDILFIEADKDYVIINTSNKIYDKIHLTMTDIMPLLPKGDFLRVHRGYIVRLDKITKITLKENHCIINEKKIPFGSRFRKDLLASLTILAGVYHNRKKIPTSNKTI